jgi:hypothetical protein
MRLIDLAGRRFSRLVVQGRTGTRYGHALWRCRCDCSAVVEVTSHICVVVRYRVAAAIAVRGRIERMTRAAHRSIEAGRA